MQKHIAVEYKRDEKHRKEHIYKFLQKMRYDKGEITL